MSISKAIATDRVSKIVGYQVLKGNFKKTSPNLPMRIAVFGQANTANQPADNSPVEVFSAKEAGEKFGFGSQIHIAMRILRNRLSDVLGGIPTIVYPQLEAAGATAQIDTITVTGAATADATHTVKINGRSNFDGKSLEITIESGDAVADVATKIADAINNALSCPVSAVAALGVVTLTTKWKGENAAELEVEVDANENAVGLAYAVAEDTAGTGDSSAEITSSLELFGNNWNTIVVNPYLKSRNALFEAVNGVPGADPAVGRYGAEVWKPFVTLTGDTVADTVANVTASLDKDEATIVQCPAPNSKGWNVEAAANACVLLARQAQDSPHLDISGKYYPDMPTPEDEDAGIFTKYNDRDLIVKAGGSTVTIENAKYKVQDFVTTYHPDNEEPPQFRFVRSLIQDWNVRFGYFLLEQQFVVDHAIAKDEDTTNVSGIIKPKQWKGVLNDYFEDLTSRAIIVEPEFSEESLEVGTSELNPDRVETFFRYKRSPFARIASTTAEAGFAFGL